MNTPDGYDPNCGYTWDANGRIQTFRVPASQPAESASTHAEAGPSQSGTSTALQQAPIIHSTSSSVPPALSPASTTPSTHFTGVCYVPSPVVHSSSNTATIRATGGAQLVTGSSSSLAIQVEHEQPGGSTERTHGKGKKRAVEAEPVAQKPSKRTKASASAAAAELDSGARQGGRQMGSSNYTEKDLRALMKAVRKVLPTGGDGWERVRAIFNAWAKRHGRPVRETKPLKNKFEALSRTRKPTGKATLPWYVKVAKKLDHRINGKVELHELDDSEMSNDSAGSSLGEDQVTLSELSDASVGGASLSNSSDIEVLEPPSNAHQSPSDPRSTETKSALRSAQLARAQADPASRASASRPRRSQAQDLLRAISASLDPAAREAREESRFARRLAEEEISRLTQQNRDLQLRNDALVDRINELQARNAQLQARLEAFELIRPFLMHTAPHTSNTPGHGVPAGAPGAWPMASPSSFRPGTPVAFSSIPEPGPSISRDSTAGTSMGAVPSTRLEALATVAADTSHAHSDTSVTVTISPSRRRTRCNPRA